MTINNGKRCPAGVIINLASHFSSDIEAVQFQIIGSTLKHLYLDGDND
jgi:hypothetical protein